MKGGTEKFEYILQVGAADRVGKPPYLLRINCTRGCAKSELSERLSDAPLGVVQIRDDIPVIVTTWIGATAYWVRAYSLTDKGPKKVFEQATKSPPIVGADVSGRPTLMLLESRFPADAVQGPLRSWAWDGLAFAPQDAQQVLDALRRAP
jgi:hypothetical protein